MLPPGMSVEQLNRMEWQTFQPDAFVRTQSSENPSRPGSHITTLTEISGEDIATGSLLMCGQRRSEIEMEREWADESENPDR